MFNPTNPFDGTWRDLPTGVDTVWDEPTEANGALDEGRIPLDGPIDTRLEGPWGIPWWDGLEDPYAITALPMSADPQPWSPREDVGGLPGSFAYEGAFRTIGGVQAWGHEPSGGLYGDQYIGRIMRFPANMPERYDAHGVWNTDTRDDILAAMANQNQPYYDDAAVTTNLLQWPNIYDRW